MSRPSSIGTLWPVLFTTITDFTVDVCSRASSIIFLSSTIFPFLCPPSAVITSFAFASSILSATADAPKPAKTNVNAAPILAAASIATGASSIMGK
jgi:hypothetical protein